jgi:CheY-like chemotaxis protein
VGGAGDRRGARSEILIAEDEADQRAIVTTCLAGAGYVPIAIASGDLVLPAARIEKPALILLDVAMPNLDGYSAWACWKISDTGSSPPAGRSSA